MFSNGGKALIAGVVLVVILPILFAAFLFYFIFIYLYRHTARAAAYILAADPDEVSTLLAALIILPGLLNPVME